MSRRRGENENRRDKVSSQHVPTIIGFQLCCSCVILAQWLLDNALIVQVNFPQMISELVFVFPLKKVHSLPLADEGFDGKSTRIRWEQG